MTSFIIFLTLLSVSALASGAETAFFSLSHSDIRLMQKQGVKNAGKVAKLRESPQRLLITVLLLNALINTSLASYATILATGFFGDERAGLVASIATGVVTLLILVLGEIFPKSFAITHKRAYASRVAPLFMVIVWFTAPIGLTLLSLERKVMRLFGEEKKQLVSEEEVRAMAELGLEQGGIDQREHAMIERIFRFDDTAVSEIMTPVKDIVMLDGSAGIDNLAYFAAHEGFSRYPVYVDNRDNVIGYVHIGDILEALNSDDRGKDLATIIRPVTHIADSMKLENAFIHMTRERSHLFMVHKAHHSGNIVGLVTMEDLIEQIVGEIEDEGDREDLLGARGRNVI